MWAGGKSKLLKHYEGIFPILSTYDLFVEPFFGGGAVWADIQSSQFMESVINDANEELMGVLKGLRDDSSSFLRSLSALTAEYLVIDGKENRKAYYYDLRKQYWSDPDPSTLYFLMRLGFNGIWQTCKDSNGLFGTPAGLLNHKREEQIFKTDNMRDWARSLQRASIYSGDYSDLDFDPQNALVYLDPPYRDSFTSYGTGFNDDDQGRLVSWAKGVASGGGTVLLANRCVPGDDFFEDLLPEAEFHYFDVTYTAGRRKKNEDNTFSAKPAREFLAIMTGEKSPAYIKQADAVKRGSVFDLNI